MKSDSISRKALLEVLEKEYKDAFESNRFDSRHDAHSYGQALATAITKVENAPSLDAVSRMNAVRIFREARENLKPESFGSVDIYKGAKIGLQYAIHIAEHLLPIGGNNG